MRPLSLELCHFLNHAATTVDLTVSPVIGFQGPNGSGKSALFEAIRYALFGRARGGPDELVQLGHVDMSVTLEFDHQGDRYRVIRRRTARSGGKSSLDLHVRVDGQWMPFGGESIAGTQAVIERLIGLDLDTFDVAVLLGQGRANRWAEATGTERKATLATILALEVWDRAKEAAAGRRRALAGSIEAEQRVLEHHESQLRERSSILVDLEATRKVQAITEDVARAAAAKRDQAEEALRALAGSLALADAASDDVVRLEGELAAAEARGIDARARIDSAEHRIDAARAIAERAPEYSAAAAAIPDATAAVAALEDRMRRLATRQTELAERRAELVEVEAAHQRAMAEYSRRHSLAQQRVADLQAHVDGLSPVACPRCRHRFAADPAGLAQALSDAQAALRLVGLPPDVPVKVARLAGLVMRAEENVRADAVDPDELAGARAELLRLQQLAGQADLAAAAAQTAQEARHDRDAAQRARDEALEAWRGCRDALEAARVAADSAAELRRQQGVALGALASSRTEAAAAADEVSRLQGNASRLEERIASLDLLAERVVELRARLEDAALLERRLEALVRAFGPNGIPARIIAGVLPELASHGNEVLAELRPGMTLELRAQRAAKSRDGVVEALDLVVRDEAGERSLAMFSGGERMSVSLALAVALSRLVARRAGTSIRFLGIDEPDGLDRVARAALAGQLEAVVARRLLDLVLVVTHHEDLAERLPASYRLPDMALVA